jgi:hypothetical protein
LTDITSQSSDFADFVLRRLRLKRIQVRLVLNHINTVGVALSGGLIDGEDAISMLGEVGLDFIITGAPSE